MGSWCWKGKGFNFDLQNDVKIMGILNVTPDSFSGDGVGKDPERAVELAMKMIRDGADIIDIGGESTRPGSQPVELEEEMDRVLPIIQQLRKLTSIPLSIDTWKARVADWALKYGANIVNDISGLTRDPEMVSVVQKWGAGCVVMHMRGTPQTMQNFTDYQDVVESVNSFFQDQIHRLTEIGILPTQIAIDPGIGFSKTWEQNLELIRQLPRFNVHHRPVLIGPSRKSFIGKVLGLDRPIDRVWGTTSVVSWCIFHGARIVRVHDVQIMRDVVDMAKALLYYQYRNQKDFTSPLSSSVKLT